MSARVQVADPLFEQTDRQHLPHPQQQLCSRPRGGRWFMVVVTWNAQRQAPFQPKCLWLWALGWPAPPRNSPACLPRATPVPSSRCTACSVRLQPDRDVASGWPDRAESSRPTDHASRVPPASRPGRAGRRRIRQQPRGCRCRPAALRGAEGPAPGRVERIDPRSQGQPDYQRLFGMDAVQSCASIALTTSAPCRRISGRPGPGAADAGVPARPDPAGQGVDPRLAAPSPSPGGFPPGDPGQPPGGPRGGRARSG
jgi:hypothetical protein